MANGSLLDRLRGIVGSEHLVTHERQLATYASDGLLQYAATPLAVVLPGSAEEVAAVVRACHERGRAVGGARRRIGPLGRRAAGRGGRADRAVAAAARPRGGRRRTGASLVEPGVTNIAVSQAVAPTHFFPPDPSSQIVCTIGGNVAENSGGAHCFKYGFTTNYVSGLEVVLPDGSVVQLGGPELDHPGYDLRGRVRGLRGHARHRHEDLAARDPEARGLAHARGVLRLARSRRARWCRGSWPRGSSRARSR